MEERKKQKEFDPFYMENTKIMKIITKGNNIHINERIRIAPKRWFSFFSYVVRKYNPFR